jgi:hypothetical protein
MSHTNLLRATLAALFLGAGLMLAFDVTITRILGVALILAFIVLGAFTVATPEYLAEEEDETGRS